MARRSIWRNQPIIEAGQQEKPGSPGDEECPGLGLREPVVQSRLAMGQVVESVRAGRCSRRRPACTWSPGSSLPARRSTLQKVPNSLAANEGRSDGR